MPAHRSSRWPLLLLLSAACSSAPPPVAKGPDPVPEDAAHWEVGEASSVHLPHVVKPLSYKLELAVDPRLPTFSGVTTISIEVREATDRVVLHGRDLAVESAELRREGETIKAGVHMRKAFGAVRDEEEMVLHLEQPAAPGRYELEIAYEAPFGTLLGLYRVDQAGESYAFTQLESTYARRMFPSFDEPRHKVPFEVELIVPTELAAFANTKEVRAEPEDGGKNTRHVFAKTEPLPTYLVAIAVGKLERVQGAAKPTSIGLVATPQAKADGAAALEAAQASLVELEKYFGRPYPYDKLDVVAVPNFAPGAMENAGLVTFREELVLMPPGTSRRLERSMKVVMMHELAHQWFGNLVTMHWWDDIWLNEGFATWMGTRGSERAFAGYDGETDRVMGKDLAMRFDALPTARAVRQTVDTADRIQEVGGWSAYQKGAAILWMLEAYSGEEAFRTGIRAYVDAQANKSITSAELFAALEQATKKPIGKIAQSLLDKPGVPLVEMIVSGCPKDAKPGKNDKAKVAPQKATLELTAFSLGGPPGASYAVPVCVRPDQGEPVCALLDGPRTSVALPSCPSVLVPNAGEYGYYRYDTDEPTFVKLLAKLNTLAPAERAGVIANTWALVLGGRRGSEDVLRVLGAIDWKKERSRVVFEAAISVLEELEQTLVDERSRKDFGKLVSRVLGPVVKELGTAPRAGEPMTSSLLRAAAVGALFDLGDDAALAKKLGPLGRAYLDQGGGAGAPLDADVAQKALEMLAAQGGAIGAEDLERAKHPQLRVMVTRALAKKRDEAGLRGSLDLLLDGRVRSGDVRYLTNGATERPETRAIFFDWLGQNLDVVAEKVGGSGRLVGTLASACGDEPAAVRFEKLVEGKLGGLESARRAFEEGRAARERCGRLRQAEAEAFAKALSKQ